MAKERLAFGSYDGEYPNLCSGKLVLVLDGKEITFPAFCLSSGGAVWFDDNWDEHVDSGPWSICVFPKGFPKELEEVAEELVNMHVEQGCLWWMRINEGER